MSVEEKRIEELTIWAKGKLEIWANQLASYNIANYDMNYRNKAEKGTLIFSVDDFLNRVVRNEFYLEAKKRWTASNLVCKYYTDSIMSTLEDSLLNRAIESLQNAGFQMIGDKKDFFQKI